MARILILGGTGWLGGTVARLAVAAGHDVTCLARGTSGPVPEGARLVRGDRDDPEVYAAELGPREWDLVLDVTRQPGQARGALRALSDRARGWAMVSTGSVYARHDVRGADEGSPLLPALESGTATVEQYGEGKVACEQAVVSERGPDAVIARAGLIVGHGDPSDRFGYWPGRFALAAEQGGPVLVPEAADRPAQWIDVQALAAWLLRAGLSGTTGIFDAVGPSMPLEVVLRAAADAAGFEGRFVPASDEQLRAASVEEYMGSRSLPLWIADPEWAGFQDRSGAAAADAGLVPAPLEETIRGALAWEHELGLDRPRRGAGLGRDEELAIIEGLPLTSTSR